MIINNNNCIWYCILSFENLKNNYHARGTCRLPVSSADLVQAL